MFGPFKPRPNTSIDVLIEKVILEMQMVGPDADEYKPLLKKLERLMKIKAESHSPRVSRDTLILAGANLIGIGITVWYEQHYNAVLSKAYPGPAKMK